MRQRPEQALLPADSLEYWRVSLCPLAFWILSDNNSQLSLKMHHQEYHHGLPQMARDYLGIPAATVDLERRFSIAGNMITKRRHRLLVDTVRACQLLRSWKEAGLWDTVKFWETQTVLK